jgi:hypothetical protein
MIFLQLVPVPNCWHFFGNAWRLVPPSFHRSRYVPSH